MKIGDITWVPGAGQMMHPDFKEKMDILSNGMKLSDILEFPDGYTINDLHSNQPGPQSHVDYKVLGRSAGIWMDHSLVETSSNFSSVVNFY